MFYVLLMLKHEFFETLSAEGMVEDKNKNILWKAGKWNI